MFYFLNQNIRLYYTFKSLFICVNAAMTLFSADLRWTINFLNIMIFVGIHF